MKIFLIFMIVMVAYVIFKRELSKSVNKQSLGTVITRNATFGIHSSFNRTLDGIVSSIKSDDEIIVVDRVRDQVKGNSSRKTHYEGKEIQIKSISVKQGKGVKKIASQFSFSFALLKELKKHAYDIDLIYTYDFDTGIVVWFFVILNPHISYYYHVADFYADSRFAKTPKVLRQIIASCERMVMRGAKRTFICVDYRYQQVGKYNRDNISVIHNSPVLENESYIRSQGRKIVERPIVIGYVGTLKDTRLLYEAIEVISNTPNIEFHIAGVGKDAEKIKSLSKERVKFFGQIAYEDTFDFYMKSDIILSVYDPEIENHKYSAPNKFYEAMLLGKSIVVAHGSGVDTLVLKHGIGYVIDYSKDALSTLLHFFLTDEGMKDLQDKQEKSYETYEIYSWESQKNKICEYLREDFHEKNYDSATNKY